MKSIKNHMIKFSRILMVMLFSVACISSPAQDEEPEMIDLDLTFSLQKLHDGARTLSIKAGSRVDKEFIAAEGITINFYGDNFGEEELIGTVTTDEYGKAIHRLEPGIKLPVMDSMGNYYLIARFDGDDKYFETEVEIEAVEGFIEMTIDEEDGLKNIMVKVYGFVEEGEEVPVEWASVSLYVPRLFSMLKVKEEFTDEEGKAYFEFPDDIPGDALGNLEIYARFEGDEFGMLESKTEKLWGIPMAIDAEVNVRALWSNHAPIWMIITLTILILGVWGHYAFVVLNLRKIRRDGKSEIGKEIAWENE